MGYINGNKVFQVVTVETPKYKHHVKMQGEYGGVNFTIYADLISTDGTNWATAGFNWNDVINDFWEGVIAGYDNQNNKYQYMTVDDALPPSYQAELFYDIESSSSATANASAFTFITDRVTQL